MLLSEHPKGSKAHSSTRVLLVGNEDLIPLSVADQLTELGYLVIGPERGKSARRRRAQLMRRFWIASLAELMPATPSRYPLELIPPDLLRYRVSQRLDLRPRWAALSRYLLGSMLLIAYPTFHLYNTNEQAWHCANEPLKDLRSG
jgi:hypothetical protein